MTEPTTKINAKLTREEYARLMWLLHRPCPPGREMDLDRSLIRKFGGVS